METKGTTLAAVGRNRQNPWGQVSTQRWSWIPTVSHCCWFQSHRQQQKCRPQALPRPLQVQPIIIWGFFSPAHKPQLWNQLAGFFFLSSYKTQENTEILKVTQNIQL